MLSKQIRQTLNYHIHNFKWYDNRINKLISEDSDLTEKEWHKQWENTVEALNREIKEFQSFVTYINMNNMGNNVWKSLKY